MEENGWQNQEAGARGRKGTSMVIFKLFQGEVVGQWDHLNAVLWNVVDVCEQ